MSQPAMAESFTVEELNAIVEQRVREALAASAQAHLAADPKPSTEDVAAFDRAALRRLVTIVGFLAAAGPVIVTVVLWFIAFGGDQRENELREDAQTQSIAETTERLDEHITAAARSLNEIKKATIENQVLIVDSVDHITKKIDALSNRTTDEPEPETLENARKVTDRAKAEQALFGKPPVTHTPTRE